MRGTVALLAAGLVVLGVLIALELALRAHAASDPGVPPDLAPHELYRTSADPELRYELIPGARVTTEPGVEVAINAAGFRGALPSPQPPAGVERVVVLGDSETLGVKLGERDTLPAQLERALGARHGGAWEVLNLGVEGYDTRQETRLFETRGAALRPSVVVLYFVSNDVLPPELVRVADGWDRSLAIRWFRDLLLMRRAARLVGSGDGYRTYVEEVYAPDSPVWAEARRRVRRLADEVEAANARFVVAVAPEIFGLERREELVDTPYRAFHRALASLAEDGLAVMDPLPALAACAERPRELWATATDHHKNGRANRCIAEFLAASGAFAPRAPHTEGL